MDTRTKKDEWRDKEFFFVPGACSAAADRGTMEADPLKGRPGMILSLVDRSRIT